jgi:hypothetical protein
MLEIVIFFLHLVEEPWRVPVVVHDHIVEDVGYQDLSPVRRRVAVEAEVLRGGGEEGVF